jgi:signal transduction histidine kinase
VPLETPVAPGRRTRLVATYAPTALVLLVGFLTLRGLGRERAQDSWVRHTQAVQLELERTWSDVLNAESRQRGFILTTDTVYLKGYKAGDAAVRQHAAELARLTADNPEQQRRASSLAALLDARLVRLERNVNLGRAGHLDSAVMGARLGVGRALMDSVKAIVAAMTAAEDSLLAARLERAEGQERATMLIVVLGAVITAGFALYMNGLLGGLIRAQSSATAQLTSQNQLLQDQATELQDANERLSEQAVELELQAEQLQEQAIELEQQRDSLLTTSVELEERTAAAEEANRAKTDFLRAMSHELRTPLNAIAGYTQLLDLGIRGPVNAEQKEDLARITRSQRHLLSLINDILNYAKIEAGHVTYEELDVSLHEMVRGVDDLVRPQMDTKSITYRCDPGPEDLLVRVDPEKTIQILLNLLSNAIKFTPQNGLIQVSVEEVDGMACVKVRDNGPGIEWDRQEQIFEPFVQVGRTLSGTSEGTGLGLAISRDLARAMNGDLTVESVPGQGATFTMCLPTTARAVV